MVVLLQVKISVNSKTRIKKGKRNQKKKVNKTNTAVKAKKERARRERDTSLKHSMTQISGTM